VPQELYPCNIEMKCECLGAARALNVDLQVSEVSMQISSTTIHICLDIVNMLRQSVQSYFSNQEYDTNLSLQKAATAAAGADMWAVKSISPDTWLDVRNGNYEASIVMAVSFEVGELCWFVFMFM
jgi:YbbR domain-containing protein